MSSRLLTFVALFVLAIIGCRGTAVVPRAEDLGSVADFSLINQTGGPIARAELLRRVWVASFIFTRCAGPCSQVSGTMARLQHELADQKEVVLVSFTVDPEYDTPQVLQKYAKSYEADPARWFFVTGPNTRVYDLIRGSFHLGVEQNDGEVRKPGYEVTHSTKLAVVDRNGHIRGYYDGTQADDVPKLRRCVTSLLAEKS